MDFGSLFLILALALATALFIGRPFFEQGPAKAGALAAQQAVRPEDQQRSALLAERDRLVSAVKELEFDQALGKIPAEDYPVQRAALLQAGAEVLRQLEALPAAPTAAHGAAAARPEGLLRNGLPPEPLDELEELILSHRKARQEKAAGFCPGCGKPVRTSDRFCASCGAEI